ncbi:MAG TPA: transposase [Methanobacterium sp.]|nr:transposase [Methanobacterium sp.]
MFKENREHLQQTFLSSIAWMSEEVKNKLLKSWASVYYEEVFCKIDETIFACLYSVETGRINFPVNILLSLEYFKHIFDYSDEELINQFYFNVQISYALGLKNVGELNLAPRTLYYFRERINKYVEINPQKEDLIYQAFLELTKKFVEEVKIKTKEQRMDSTLIKSNIKDSSRLALAMDVLGQAIKVMPMDIFTDEIKRYISKNYRNSILYKTKSSDVKTKLKNIIEFCIEIRDYAHNILKMNATTEIKTLNRFIEEQTKNTNIGIYEIKENKEIKSSFLQSAYDTDATYKKKSKKESKGYVVNIAETCSDENGFQIITDYVVEKNIKSDISMAKERFYRINDEYDCEKMYLDGGYYGDELEDIAKECKIKTNYTNMVGGIIEKDGINISDFEISNDYKVCKCPMGAKAIGAYYSNDLIKACFLKVDCGMCKMKNKCIVEEGKDFYRLIARKKTLTAELVRNDIIENKKVNTSRRVAIEGTNSELKRRHKLDDTKIRGLKRMRLVVGLKITACNIKRLIKNTVANANKSIKLFNQVQSVTN